MNMKSFVETLIAITVISLNTISTENSTKMVIENETIYEFNESIAEIKDELEDEPVESKPQLKIHLKSNLPIPKIIPRMNLKMLILTAILRKAKSMLKVSGM